MSLADDVRELGRLSKAALDEGLDYFTHGREAWRLLQVKVKRGSTFTITNTTTGKVADAKALTRLIPLYVSNYHTTATFQLFVTIFEAFLFDLLRLWLGAHPGSLSAKDVKFGEVLKASSLSDVTLAVVDRELNELKYGRVADWFKYLEGRAGLGCPPDVEIETIAEIKASRDILVHNRGIVNAVYLAKAGRRARYADGERLEILLPYFLSCWDKLQNVMRDVTEAAARKA